MEGEKGKTPEDDIKNDYKTVLQDKDDRIKELETEIKGLKKQIESLTLKPDTKLAVKNPLDNNPRKIKWKKYGGGTFRMGNGKIIKPNQVFDAYPHEIPNGVRDIVKPLNDLDLVEEPGVNPIAKFELKEKGNGWWNVVEPVSGKIMNEKGLRKEAAEQLLKELS